MTNAFNDQVCTHVGSQSILPPCTFLRPIMEYCSLVWDPGYAVSWKGSNQSFAARLATGGPSTEELRQELGWPLLVNRRAYLKICLCRRILTGDSLIPDSVFIPAKTTCQLYLPFVRTNYHKHSFFISTVPIWNSIPEQIISLVSNTAFKASLRKFLVV